MPGLSVYASNALLNRAFGGASLTRPATVYLEPYTALPDNTGSGGTAPSGNGYSGRIAVTNNTTAFPAASSGIKTNGALVLGTCSGGTWGTLNGIGIWDASSSGNLLALFEFAEPLVTVSGKRVKIRASQLYLSLSGGWDSALANSLLDHLLGGPDYTPPATWYSGLLTSSAELSGNGYARIAVTNNSTNFPSASNGEKSNGAAVEFGPASGGSWSQATRMGFYTASSGGTVQSLGSLVSPVTVATGQLATFDIAAMDLSITRTDSNAIPGFDLVFQDEFNSGAAPDYTTKYYPIFTWGTGDDWGPGGADDMREDETIVQGDTDTTDRGGYSSTIATVSGGELHLRTVDTVTRFAGANYDHGTSMIRTQQSWLFGLFVIRMKIPAGQGFLPQLWLMPEEYDDNELFEVDILECPFNYTTEVKMNAHWGSGYGGPNHHQDLETISMDPTQWHIYSLEWTPTQYIWAVDGSTVKTFTHGSGGRVVNTTRPMELIINLDVGGSWSGATDGTTPFPSSIDVDYIRVYQES